ncbi:ABC transporter substrate-binding protein [Microbacterium aurugineum]
MNRTLLSRPLLRGGVASLAGLIAIAALAGCSPTGAPDAASDESIDWKLTETTPAPTGDIDSFSFATYAEPYSLDYAYAFDYADNSVLANVCESLLRLNPDYSLSPGLAESFEHPTPDTWVYTIRDGVTFHDGTPLTAADAVASMSRHLDPAVGSFWYSVYQNVKSIEQTGAREVTVTMTGPDSQFNLGMGGAAGVIESAATLTAKGADYGNSTGGVNCTGPFQLTWWDSGESIAMSRYDGYWDEDLRAHSGEVEFVFMTDPTARINALKSGSVDGSWMVPMEAVPTLRSAGEGDVLFGMNTAVGNVVVSDLEGPLGDLRVRKALLLAMDRDGILQAAYRGVGETTDVMTTESVWKDASDAARTAAFEDITSYGQNLEEAKRLIAEAGAEGAELTYVTAPISNDFSVISQATVAAAQSIGLKVNVETVTPNAYTALFSDPSAREGVDLFYTSWYLSSPDALEMYSVLRTGDFSNYGGWSNPEFDAILQEAVTIDDPAARSELTAKAQQIANAELPWLPLYQAPVSLYLGERITGVQPSIAFMYYPWAATIGAR